MLFSVLDTNMAFAVPMLASDITYFQAETTHIVQVDNVSFAARAPPLAVTNVEVTGGGAVMQGSAFALHGQKAVAALFGFGADHIVLNGGLPDRRVEITVLFNNGNPRNGIQIGNRTVLVDPTNPDGARVFSGVSDTEVQDYFTQLIGQTLPAPRTITIGGRDVQLYTVTTPDGNFNLRAESTSTLPNGQTPSWTIDGPNTVTGLRGGQGVSELKFE